MLLEEISKKDKILKTKILSKKKKKNNPIEPKNTKIKSFIDVFGGMSGYMNPDDQAVQ